MRKVCYLILLVAVYCSEKPDAEPGVANETKPLPPPGKPAGKPVPPPMTDEQIQEILNDKVVMPEIEGDDKVLTSFDKTKCIDKALYKNKDKLLNVTSESDYLCAFIAFQANKVLDPKIKSGVGKYVSAEDATMRFGIFKKCVNEVNEQNGKEGATWTAAVNFFCDMTTEEKCPYGHGILRKGEKSVCEKLRNKHSDVKNKTKKRTFTLGSRPGGQ